MKAILLPLTALLALALTTQAADVSSKISKVHLCCKGCVNGVEKAVGEVEGAKADVDADGGTVTLSGPDTATVQKAANALVKAGYSTLMAPGALVLRTVAPFVSLERRVTIVVRSIGLYPAWPATVF